MDGVLSVSKFFDVAKFHRWEQKKRAVYSMNVPWPVDNLLRRQLLPRRNHLALSHSSSLIDGRCVRRAPAWRLGLSAYQGLWTPPLAAMATDMHGATGLACLHPGKLSSV
jgi:hypothetical protein